MNKYEHNNTINLFLGDIIRIVSPSNVKYDNKIYFIDYLDKKMIKLINKEDTDFLYLGKTGELTDHSIKEIHVIRRSKENSYVKLNNLLVDTWVDIKFGGDIPFYMTALITNIIEDMIEIKRIPNQDTLFIDFAYKGIPQDLNIEYIKIREEPISVKDIPTQIEENQENQENQEKDVEKKEESEQNNDMDIRIKDNEADNEADNDNSISDTFQSEVPVNVEYNNSDDEYDEEQENVIDKEYSNNELLGFVTQYVNVVDSKKRYTIEEQKDDMLNKYLDSIPAFKQNNHTQLHIQKLINRFEDLREEYTIFDKNENPLKIKSHGRNFNTLKDVIKDSNSTFQHIIPVTVQKKKIYDITGDHSDIIKIDFPTDRNNQYQSNNSYESNNMNYIDYMSVINEYLTPYVRPNSNEYLYSIKAKHDTTSIINNDDMYETTTIGNDTQNSVKFLTQTHLSNISFNDNIIMQNDYLDIKSLITLPFCFAQMNKINMYKSNILEKVVMSQRQIGLSDFFTDKLKLNTNLISKKGDALVNNKNYENVFNTVTEHILDDDIERNNDVYNKFFSTALPHSIDVIRHVMKKRKTLSFDEFIKLVEPYNIYSNNIHFHQYKEILDGLYKNINMYWQNYKQQRKQYNITVAKLKKFNKTVPTIMNDLSLSVPTSLYDDLSDTSNDSDKFDLNTFYMKNASEFQTSNELFAHTNKFDNSSLLIELLKFNTNSLVNDIKIDYQNLLTENDSEKKDTDQEICQTYTVSKKYKTISDLNMDNNKSIYYDKVYDDTVYDVLNVYNSEKLQMKDDEFLEFLKNKLIAVNGIPEKDASLVAGDMMAGRKHVREGDYAILPNISEDYELSNIEYYKRTNNAWEFDEEATKSKLNTSIPIKNNLCESVNCFESTNESKSLKLNYEKNNFKDNEFEDKLTKLPVDKTFECNTSNTKNKEVKGKLLRSMMEEFKHQHLRNKLSTEDSIHRILVLNKRLMTLKNYERKQYESYAQLLGSQSVELNIQLSPNIGKLNDIMSMNDPFARNKDLLVFIHKYTRSAIHPESKYFYFCKITNTKILPTFYFKIACVMVQRKNSFDNSKYKEVINALYKEQGAESDDGGFIVDRFSGDIIAPIDYDTSEGYDEAGHQINTRSVANTNEIVIDKDDMEFTIDKITDDILEGNDNIINDDDSFQVDSYKSNIKEFVLTIINYISGEINIDLGSHKEYIVFKTITIFEKYKNKKNEEYTLVLLTIAMMFIGIQMYFPKLTGKYIRVNDCKASFKGYPLENENDFTGIEFFSCLIAKRKKKINKKLKQSDETKIKEQLITIIKSFILDNIQEDLVEIKEAEIKRQQLLSIFINKSLTFLPPLKTFKMDKSLFQNHLSSIKTTMGKGKDILDSIHVVQSKNIVFSYGIIESLNNNIKDVELHLQNHSTDEYYLENSCCSTNNITNIIDYLKDGDNDIQKYINIVDENEKFVDGISNVPVNYVSKEVFKLPYSSTSTGYTAETMNLVYDNIDVDEEYKEQTQSNMLLQLNSIYRNHNKDIISNDKSISFSDHIKSVLTKTNSIEPDDMNLNLIEYIDNTSDKHILKDIIINRVEMVQSLNNQITQLQNEYVLFTNEKKDSLVSLFTQITSTNTVQSIKNNIKKYCQSIPYIIMNNMNHIGTLPKHWNLSQDHYKTINNALIENQSFIEKFKNNDDIKRILTFCVLKFKQYEYLIDNINTISLNEDEYIIDTEMVIKILHIIFMKIMNYMIAHISTIQERSGCIDIMKAYKLDFKLYLKKYNFDNNVLQKRVLKSKEREKDRITKKLKKKSDQAREVSNILKKNKLGDWNIGEQKGLRIYDKNFRDVNRPEGDEHYTHGDMDNEFSDITFSEDN